MSGFSNFAVSFTIISILSGCLTLYGFGMNTGGPADDRLGLAVRRAHDLAGRPGDGRGLLELPDRGRPVLLVGQARAKNGPPGRGSPAGSTSSARSRSPRASTSARRSSSTPSSTCSSASRDTRAHDPAVRPHPGDPRAAEHVRRARRHAQRHQRVVARRRRAGHRRRAGLRADQHQDASFVFGHFVNNTGWTSTFYVALLGLLLAQYTFTGLRRVGAHDRGDARRGPAGPRGHRHVDRGVAGRGLDPADRADLRHPDYDGATRFGHRRAAGADLHRRGRRRPAASSCC
jgi:hypothetical protein